MFLDPTKIPASDSGLFKKEFEDAKLKTPDTAQNPKEKLAQLINSKPTDKSQENQEAATLREQLQPEKAVEAREENHAQLAEGKTVEMHNLEALLASSSDGILDEASEVLDRAMDLSGSNAI